MPTFRFLYIPTCAALLFFGYLPTPPADAAREKKSPPAKARVKRNIPVTVAFRRTAEPKEHAFTMLVPRGWLVEGGIFRVDPNSVGGTINSIEAKCDISIKSDRAGTVMLRRLPKINYADGPMLPATHGPGMNYNGATVVAMPSVENYLIWLLNQSRPAIRDLKVISKEPLPKLAELFTRLSGPMNKSLATVGIRPSSYQAGFLLVEYSENGQRYKELLSTVLIDARASMAVWSNDLTTMMRAPADEADRWKPVLDIVANSVQLDAKWLSGELRGQGERADIAKKLVNDIARIDREIAAHRTRTQQGIQTDQYLTITGQNDYSNPYTGKLERDTSDWSRRWVNASGEYIYSNDTSYDPNADPDNPRHDYKLTRPKGSR